MLFFQSDSADEYVYYPEETSKSDKKVDESKVPKKKFFIFPLFMSWISAFIVILYFLDNCIFVRGESYLYCDLENFDDLINSFNQTDFDKIVESL